MFALFSLSALMGLAHLTLGLKALHPDGTQRALPNECTVVSRATERISHELGLFSL
jgi:hypothetical protein